MADFKVNPQKVSNYSIWESYYNFGSKYDLDNINCTTPTSSRCTQRYTMNIPRILVNTLTDYILSEFEYPKTFKDLDISLLIKNVLIYGEILVIYPESNFFIYTPNNFKHLDNDDILLSLEDGMYILRDNKMYIQNANKTLTYIRELKFKTIKFFNDNNYPYGKSLYADCLDIFDSVDMKYSYMVEEFVLGKPMIIVDPTALRVEELRPPSALTTTPSEFRQYYDDKANIFKFIPRQDLADPTVYSPVEQIEFKLRVNEFITSIDFDLGLIAQACNFDSNFLKIDSQMAIQRQTQVLSSKSMLYNMIRSCQKSIVEFMSTFGFENYKEEDFSIGDSIITDDNAKQLQGNTLYSIKVIDRLTLLMDFYNYTEEQAMIIIDRVKQEQLEQNELELSMLSEGQDNISFEEDSLVPPIINEPNINQTTLPTQIPQT